MYIESNGQRYRCTDAVVGGDPVRFALPEGEPEQLGNTIGLYQDDGFELLTIQVGDYERAVMAGNVLTLTNQPEVEPPPAPEPEEPDGLEERVAALEASKADKSDLAELSAAIERGLEG